MKRTKTLFAALSIVAMVGACTDQPPQPTEDDLAGETAADGELGKADFDVNTFTYYTVEPDTRRCVYPVCGGVWVSRVNRYYTKCADGSWQQSCYVADFDIDGLGLDDKQVGELRSSTQVLYRGTIEENVVGTHGNMGKFVASEAWQGLPDANPEGLFVKAGDNGIRCITTPCPSTSEAKLNSWRATDLEELDFDWTGASQELIDQATAAMFSEDKLIVAGYRYWWWENGSWHKGRAATQFYLRVKPQSDGCFVGGCSSQVCSGNEDVVTTCEWLPQYACYRTATCERQPTGECGWTPTEALQQCLDNPPN